uniref:Carboxylesterase type B domain-containing protein n=1 Tax=Acrobeloides nanus TaxID=290746 RepID=A0A914BUN4_9BILA
MHATDEVQKIANTFFFVFGHETRAWVKEQPNSGIRGSFTEDHVPYILGYPLSMQNREDQLFSGFTGEDKGISRVMMHYVSNFVKSGDPSKPLHITTQTTIEERFHSTPWPQFSQASREAYLEITDRPRVKNYYRNAFVGFWNSFVPQLNAGSKDGSVPEEHNFLPDHFNKQTFFGVVRPYGSFHNLGFLPPPTPPPFPPSDLKKKLTTTLAPTQTTKPPETKLADAKSAETSHYSNMLAATVALGCGLLLLNICVYVAIIRLCIDRKRKSKKQLKYQSFASNSHPPNSDPLNYIPTLPLNNQEPLLSKTGTPAILRPGVSPTCPRHGRAAQMMIAASRTNSIGSSFALGTGGPTLEEVQV